MKTALTVFLSGVTAAVVTYLLNSLSKSKDVYRAKLEEFYMCHLEIVDLIGKNMLLINKVVLGIEDIDLAKKRVKDNRQKLLALWLKTKILNDLYIRDQDGTNFSEILNAIYQKGHIVENEFLATGGTQSKRKYCHEVLEEIGVWEDNLRKTSLLTKKYI